MSEKKKLRPATYLVAAIGYAIMQSKAEEVVTLRRANDFAAFFASFFGRPLSDKQVEGTLNLMHRVELLQLDDDEYAGRFFTTQKTAVDRRFRQLADAMPDSPFAIILRAKLPWITDVFGTSKFWSDVDDDLAGGSRDDAQLEANVPASDRTVTLLHNSPERQELSDGLEKIHHELTTSNSVAEEIGEDRERLTAEIEASKVGIKSERIKVQFLHDIVLKVLKELAVKLRDKALEMGVERLIAIVEHLIGTIS